MSDHIKELAEMSGISIDTMRAIVTAQEQVKLICDHFGVESLSELDALKKSVEQAAALNWLSAITTPKRVVGRTISVGANRTSPTTSASETHARQRSTSPAATLATVTRHMMKTRTRELDAEIEQAKEHATNASDHHSLFAALVEIAGKGNAPFTGRTGSRGIEYKHASSGKVAYFSKEALKGRMRRDAERIRK